MGVVGRQSLSGQLRLGAAQPLPIEQDLARQVARIHHIAVGQPQGADPGPGEIEGERRAEAAETENKDLFEEIKKALNGKIKDVKVNPTLQDHPVSLSSEGGISMEMEKILRKMPAGGEGMESTKVLELNPNHAVFGALKAAHEAGDTDKINKYAELLYDQALLIEGLPLEDIATRLELSLPATKSRLHRARMVARELLADPDAPVDLSDL